MAAEVLKVWKSDNIESCLYWTFPKSKNYKFKSAKIRTKSETINFI